jgi:L-rhamnose mutarotase
MRRIGTLMKLKPGALNEYVRLHDVIWDEVVQAGYEAGMRNYTIFHRNGYLFSYYEYIGDNFEADMDLKNALPVSKRWQKATGSLRECIEGDSLVIMLDEIWHHDFLPHYNGEVNP